MFTAELLSVDNISACSSSRKGQEKQEPVHRVQNALVSSEGRGGGREKEGRGGRRRRREVEGEGEGGG